MSKIFFRFDKRIIKDEEKKIWSKLSNASRAVYPVLGVHAHIKTGVCYPSRSTTAELAGYNKKTYLNSVTIAGKELQRKGLLTYKRKKVKGKTYSFSLSYTFTFPKNQYFQFWREMIDDGIWAKLSAGEKNLYVVLRSFPYSAIEKDESFSVEDYRNRGLDFCSKSISYLAEHAGLKKRATIYALNALQETGIVCKLYNEEKDQFCYAIYVRSSFEDELNTLINDYDYLDYG